MIFDVTISSLGETMTSDALLVTDANLTVEEFDGETVLINVARGLYYSLTGAATELWRAFSKPRAASEVLDALCAQLPNADRTSLQGAIQSMREYQLLAPLAALSATSPEPFTVVATMFVPPTVEVYSDLADLIAIDPVHEVDAASGWPVRPESFPDAD